MDSTTALPSQKSIIAIDIWRAVAALGVFLYHNHMGYVLSQATGLSFFRAIDVFGAGYAVPLFFLLSGYCIHIANIKFLRSNSALPLKHYYKRRFLRIYPPYLIALLFSFFVLYLTVPGYKLDVYDLLAHAFLLHGFTAAYFNTINVVLWTITIEMAFYLIYPLFYNIRLKYGAEKALLFTLLVSAVSIAYFQSKNGLLIPEHFFVLNLWFSWCCGAYLADKKMLDPAKLKKPVYWAIYLLVAIGFIRLKILTNSWTILSDQVTILIWTAPLMLSLNAENWLQKHKNTWLIKLMVAIGLSSYSLYLFHEPLIHLKNLAVHAWLPPALQRVAVALGILLIPLITWCCYLYFERPFINRKAIVAKNG